MTTILLAGLLSLLLPEQAHAQVTGIINGIGSTGGMGTAQDIFNTVQNAGRSLLVVISTLMLVRAAAKMIGSISDEKLEEGRRSVGTTIGGIILINLTYALVTAFWNGGDHGIQAGASQLSREINGLVEWAQVVVGVLAVAMIIVSAFKVIASFGKDEGGDELKKAITGAIVGVMLIAFDTVLITALGAGGNANPTTIVGMIVSIVAELLKYLALLAVIVIIYAGIMMIVTVGSDEQYGKSKALIGRVLIGLLIVLFSYFIVTFISGAILGGGM